MLRAVVVAFAGFAVASVSLPSLAQVPATPGPEMEVLEHSLGTWDCLIKGPDGAEMSKGEAVYKKGPGGLWLVSDFKGAIGPVAFEGHGVDGYDQDKRKYVSVWVDSMTSAPTIFEGDYDADTKTMTMFGAGKGPDGKPVKFKNVTKIKDADHQTFTMFMVGPGDTDIPMMTIDYKRRK
jgi:hypothetical protein